MVQKHNAKQRHYWMIAACGLLIGTSALQGCKDDDVLTGQPSWLGNSIYERLDEDGNYKTMLKLIDDLGQHEVLSHTGSKTLFAANDEAFNDWFKNGNPWGVNSYDKLSLAQKKLLLNNSMVNNAYLIELLSNGKPQGEDNHPEEGRTMRRLTASSVYDSVQIMRPDQMPNTEVWAKFKNNGRSIPILKDASAAPMIHFLPAFMKYTKFTNNDLEVLTNHQANNINEAWVNGKKVVERDITCKNGYIQKVEKVIESSSNMADIIHQHPEMSKWAELMDRFCAPYYDAEGTKEYNRLYNNQDSVYVLRYYSDYSANGENLSTPDGKAITAKLPFDPGWNQYVSTSGDGNMNYDAGAMIVPTNEALKAWWDNEGKDLKTEYGEIDSLPDATLAKLIKVNMLPVFTEAIPSKFDLVLNDAKEPIGIKTSDIASCFMGCNGVVYMTNKVFTPAEFQSVSYPALAHPTTMNVIYWAIDQLNFLPYLLSMDSKYSLILPSNEAMLWYIDPYTYGNEKNGMEAPNVLAFWYDPTRTSEDQKVRAYRYECTIDENGQITIDESVARREVTDRDIINDCLKRMMDQLIIVGNIEDGHEYYKSKGGTPIRVFKDDKGRLCFAGGWQIGHNNKPLPVNSADIYQKNNGKSYIINDQMPLTTDQSVYLTLDKNEAFSKFLDLLDYDAADLLATSVTKNNYSAGMQKKGSKNLKLLDNYNYTIYVPSNNAIQKLIDDGLLPTWDDYEAQTEEVWGSEELAAQAQAMIKDIIVNFVRYHVQDHAILIGMAPENDKYENSFETMRRNLETGRFYPLIVNNEGNEMWVKDVLGNKRNVVKTNGLFNLICREYWFKSAGVCYMASDAVIHQIDGVLLPEEMTPWKDKLNKLKNQ